VERYEREQNVPAVEIAAALAKLVQGDMPLLLDITAQQLRPHAPFERGPREDTRDRGPRREFQRDRGERDTRPPRREERQFEPRPHEPRQFEPREERPRHAERQFTPPSAGEYVPPRHAHNQGEAMFDDAPASRREPREPREQRAPEVGMETFRIEVGHAHGVKPGNIVGAIANEAELESRYIGRIDIRDDHSLIDLPEGMPREVMDHLKRVRVAGQQLRISRADEDGGHGQRPHGRHGEVRHEGGSFDDDRRPPPRGPRPHGGGKPHGAGPRKPGGFKPGGFKPR
jgi:ATP-dependent RNA helicase DeaD